MKVNLLFLDSFKKRTEINCKLVYQEQVLEILHKLCGFDMAKADFYRLEMRNLEPSQHVKCLETLLTEKYGEDGKALFDYLHTYSKSTTGKVCLIAYLHKPYL